MDSVEELLDDFRSFENFDICLSDWETITKFLPEGWKQKAFDLKAIKHTDEPLGDPETLIKIFLLYLTSDCGLRQTAVKAVEGGLVPNISSVALWKRLGKAKEWLSWMCNEIKDLWISYLPKTTSIVNKKIKIVDATHVVERGGISSSWRIHYAIELDSLQCDELMVTSPRIAESLDNFHASVEDIYIGDRAYAKCKGIASIARSKADVLLRYTPSYLSLEDQEGNRFDCLDHLKILRDGEMSTAIEN